MLTKIWASMVRTKIYDENDTKLHKCLNVCDLILLGIGSMVGSGIYIVTGEAAKELAGKHLQVLRYFRW